MLNRSEKMCLELERLSLRNSNLYRKKKLIIKKKETKKKIFFFSQKNLSKSNILV
jgi:hypothetical protein